MRREPRPVRVMVRRHGRSGRCVAAVRHLHYGTRLHVTEPVDEARDAQAAARVWARMHGYAVRYTWFEHGLVGPGAIGDFTVEAEP